MSTATIRQVKNLIKSTINKVEARDRVPTSEELSAIAKLVNSLNKLEETLRQPVARPGKSDPKKMTKKQRDEHYAEYGDPNFAEHLQND